MAVWTLKERNDLVRANQAITAGNKGLFGGNNPALNSVDHLNITIASNATDFGDLTEANRKSAAAGAVTRFIRWGGETPSAVNTCDFANPFNAGNFTDFGDLSVTRRLCAGLSNSTRGVCLGGSVPGSNSDTIDYITLEATGISQDFGNLRGGNDAFGSTVASPVRGIYADGTATNGTLDFITISTTGDSQFFGDLATNRGTTIHSASNSTRGIFAGGYSNPGTGANTNIIEFVTIATLGNAQDFGDLTRTTAECNGGAASPTRAIFSGGGPSSGSDTVDYVEIASTGNAIDFGNLITGSFHNSACSNGHGGL